MARESNGRLVGGVVLVAFLLGALMLLQPPGLSPGVKRAAALALFAIVFFLLSVLLGVSPV